MKHTNELFASIADKLTDGSFGGSGDFFITTRELASYCGCSIETAVKLMSLLSDAHLIRLVGKRYYITTGYAPPSSPLGRLRDSADKKLLGAIVNNIESPFFASLVKHISNIASYNGYDLILSDSGGDYHREQRILDNLYELGCRGVFICPGLAPEILKIYRNCPLPLVSMGRNLGLPGCDTVMVDNFDAGVQVAKHLLECRCKSFVYLGLDGYIDSDPRVNGYRKFLADNGYTLADDSVMPIKNSGGTLDIAKLNSFLNSVLRRVSKAPELLPVGIFCYHDLLAAEALRIVKRFRYNGDKRLQIPDDVMLVGFDDLPITSMVTPQITTVSYRYHAIAQKAFEMMYDYITNPNHVVSLAEIRSALVIRESSGI
ncbi:MAG: substrate-binding domain-containing protein [Clostridiales bacterium]|nr:substrate-binding domain-containing protein [Clostridiales bacterium]